MSMLISIQFRLKDAVSCLFKATHARVFWYIYIYSTTSSISDFLSLLITDYDIQANGSTSCKK